MLLLIGIDDTDNADTRGTGFRARQLAERLISGGQAEVIGVTRHQLLVDPRIPYTSQNSSACLSVRPQSAVNDAALLAVCREFLLSIAAEGSDVGLCLAAEDAALAVRDFARRAKVEVLETGAAHAVAASQGIALEGLTGSRQGVIGALAAVGLFADGNDGRYIWVRGSREYENQTMSIQEVRARIGIDALSLRDGTEILDESAAVDLGPWPRPVRINHRAVLLLEKVNASGGYQVLEKYTLKSIRP